MATAKTTAATNEAATEEKAEASFVITAKDAFALPALDAWLRAARLQMVDDAAVQKVVDIRDAIAKHQNENGAEVVK